MSLWCRFILAVVSYDRFGRLADASCPIRYEFVGSVLRRRFLMIRFGRRCLLWRCSHWRSYFLWRRGLPHVVTAITAVLGRDKRFPPRMRRIDLDLPLWFWRRRRRWFGLIARKQRRPYPSIFWIGFLLFGLWMLPHPMPIADNPFLGCAGFLQLMVQVVISGFPFHNAGLDWVRCWQRFGRLGFYRS